MANSSGYLPCACRDCFEIAIGESGKAFCHECEEAGCPDYQGEPGMSQECQVEGEPGTDCCDGGVHECETGDAGCWHCDHCGRAVPGS